MSGARRLREALEVSWVTFTPYRYRIQHLHDLADPDMLVAEYSSHSTYLPRNAPYENLYIAVVRFRDGKVAHWREYVNPLVTLEALGPDARWDESRGAV